MFSFLFFYLDSAIIGENQLHIVNFSCNVGWFLFNNAWWTSPLEEISRPFYHAALCPSQILTIPDIPDTG